jgi:hypothetical protein
LRHALLVRFSVLLFASLALAACDNGETPTAPNPPIVTETFPGTLTLNGSQMHTFIASTAGTVTATLSTVEPAGSPALGFSMGTWDGQVCSASLTNNFAVQSSTLTGTVVGITPLCVRLFDASGSIPAATPVNYTITVARP